MRIGRRFTIAFVLLLCIVVPGFVYMGLSLHQARLNLSSIYEARLLGIDYLVEADRDAYQSNLALIRLVSHAMESGRINATLIAEMRENLGQVSSRFADFTAAWSSGQHHPEQDLASYRAEVALFHELYPQLQAETRQVEELLAAGAYSAAARYYNDRYFSVFVRFRSVLDRLTDVAHDQARAEYHYGLDGISRRLFVFVAVSVLVLIFASVAAMRLAASITRPLHTALDLTDRLAQGQSAVDIPARAGDEFADLYNQISLAQNIVDLAVRGAGLGVWSYFEAADRLVWNDALFKITGQNPESFPCTMTALLACVYPGDRERVRNMLRGEMDEEDAYVLTFRVLRPDGEVRYILNQGLVRRDPEGAVLAVYGVCLDITEQRMTQAVLERGVWERTTELRALNEELELFCYSVSHDLRAPLRHIVGYADLLKQEAPAAAGTPSLLKIEDSARRMGVLIDELLRFAHTTRHELRREMVDMNETVSRIRDRYMTSDPEANKKVVWRVATMPGAWGDRSLLTQVWQNLIDNALKYSHRSTPAIIEIGCRWRERYQLFFIRDNGVGFNMRNLGQVFGVFQRLHSAEDFEGHGLGLANVLRLVLRHGGRCGARSTPGRGALFYFTLPVAPAPGEIKIEKEMDGRTFADLWSPVFEAHMAAESAR